jgi:hypothetical protein
LNISWRSNSSSSSRGFRGASATLAICTSLLVNTYCHNMIEYSHKSHKSQKMSMARRKANARARISGSLPSISLMVLGKWNLWCTLGILAGCVWC